MKKQALVVIDLQNDYFSDGKWTLDGIDAAADNAVRLIDSFRRAGNLVVHVYHEFPTSDAPFFVAGSPGAAIHSKVAPKDGEPIILKNRVNSFVGTKLQALLDRHGIEHLVLCGAMSHMCIEAAARAASDLGYTCTVIHDACATRDLEFMGETIPAKHVHGAVMSALGFAYANLLATADLLATG